MEVLKRIFLLVVIVSDITSSIEIKKPTIARTELKVSRSLDPSAMQTVSVLAKDGSIAQLIVKRRDGKSQSTTTENPSLKSNNDLIKDTIQSNWIPMQANERNVANQITDEESKLTSVPKPVTVRSGNVFVKNADENKRGRSIMELGPDGIPIIHGVRTPDDESDSKIWRNARVINGELVPYETGYVPQAAVPIGQLVYASKSPETVEEIRGFGPFTTADNFALNTKISSSIGPFTVDENKQIKPLEEFDFNRNYVRYNLDGSFGPFTKADNTKISNSKLIDYIKQINEQESKRDYFTSRKYSVPFGENQENHQIQRRMLQSGGNHNYPTNMVYSPASTSRVNFNDGVRTPVLQYAHPELGVQPAQVPTEENKNPNTVTFTEAYKTTYETEPTEASSNSGRNNRNKYYENIPNNNYYRKEEVNYHYGPHYYNRFRPEQPFWMKITESIKDNLQNGIARMQRLTRPVLDPIMEATQKIGHNLGLSHPPPESYNYSAQDKIGLAPPAISTSVILPAIGLVAGGAALGLGAAAVGRFLDVGTSRNRDQALLNEWELQHKRSLEAYRELTTTDSATPAFRRKRSVHEDDKYLDNLIQSVERDFAKTSLGAHLAGSTNWADTPCAKRMFCDVMVEQPYEEINFMEKKMDSFLSMVHPVIANSISQHLQEVITAVKRQNCSQFICIKQQLPKK